MTAPHAISHVHEPVYRVVQRGWPDPLDVSFSTLATDNRWNPPDAFAVLYTCCSEQVARAITLDLFRLSGVDLDDLRPEVQPQLVEIGWRGAVVDIASSAGIAAAGLPTDYPIGVGHTRTQPLALAWHGLGAEGVLCRSASMLRRGFLAWRGAHMGWAELAVFVQNAQLRPRLLRRREDLDWYVAELQG